MNKFNNDKGYKSYLEKNLHEILNEKKIIEYEEWIFGNLNYYF